MKKIKELPVFKRPREKLKEKGAQALSDTELIAVILGRGGRGLDVMRLSAKVAKVVDKYNGQLTLDHITAVNGIGLAKASQILAGFELARRRMTKTAVTINGPGAVLPLVDFIVGKKQEYFICISLNGANEVIETRVVTIGLLNQAQVHPREVYADVIADRAAAVIFAHNHPSGRVQPSGDDIQIQHQLVEAGRILGIKVLDHLIVSAQGYYSFQEQGLIK